MQKLFQQSYGEEKLKTTLRTFYVHHHDLVDLYDVSVYTLTNDIFTTSYIEVLHLCRLSSKDRTLPNLDYDCFSECEFASIYDLYRYVCTQGSCEYIRCL